ncbi:ras protein [Mycena olivaceomarginata]|nr:ras protein [Mycena olivaceomarginata]
MDQWRLVVLGDGDAGTTALACHCFVYDPTIEDCYRKQLMWMTAYLQRINGGDSIIILVGNKCDLPASKREVSEEEGGALARQWACEFIETSAKTAHNVERAFTTLIRALRASRPPVSSTKPRPLKSKRSCVIM